MKFGEYDTEPQGRSFVPATSQGLDIEAAKALFEPYRQALIELREQAEGMEVTSDETDREAISLAASAKKFGKTVKAEMDRITADASEFVKGVRGFCKTFLDPAEEIEKNLKNKSAQFAYKRELARREQQRAIDEANRKLQADLDAQAKKSGVEPVQVAPMPAPKTPAVTRTESGASSHMRLEWKGFIADAVKVPREYCEPVQRLINEAVKAGIREIPGVEIKEVPISVIRS